MPQPKQVVRRSSSGKAPAHPLQWAAKQVISLEPHHQRFEGTLHREKPAWGCPDVVAQHKPSSRTEYPGHLRGGPTGRPGC